MLYELLCELEETHKQFNNFNKIKINIQKRRWTETKKCEPPHRPSGSLDTCYGLLEQTYIVYSCNKRPKLLTTTIHFRIRREILSLGVNFRRHFILLFLFHFCALVHFALSSCRNNTTAWMSSKENEPEEERKKKRQKTGVLIFNTQVTQDSRQQYFPSCFLSHFSFLSPEP